MKKIVDGERPSRPQGGEELGLSDELWELVQSSLAPELEKRPSASAFVDLLEQATPDIAALEELIEFDASSEDDIQKLRRMFEYGENTLLGMGEEDTLVVIEVLDRVNSFAQHLFAPLEHISLSPIQVLNSSLDDPTICGKCLRGLQVSARRGLLPRSHWISHVEPNGTSATAGGVSSTSQRLANGNLVAVKTISPDRFWDFDAFARVSPPPPPTRRLST